MVAGSKAKQPQVTGDVLRASGAMLLSHLATRPSAVPLGLTPEGRRGPERGFWDCLQARQLTAVDSTTDPQPAVRPVPRSGRAVATYVLKMSNRVPIRNAPSLSQNCSDPQSVDPEVVGRAVRRDRAS